MLNFKYTLDKSSKKFKCPNCHKQTFVKYLDNETKEYLTSEFGRCDRESKCNYHNAPPKGNKCHLVNLLSIQSISDKAYKATFPNGTINIIPKSQILERTGKDCWITEWYLNTNGYTYLMNEGKYFETEIGTIINTVKSLKEEPIQPSYHSLFLLDKMYTSEAVDDNLLTYLKSIFSEAEVFTAMQNYLITGTNTPWANGTVFWQIDQKDRIHGAKIMLYDPLTGKRIKQPYNHITWLHKSLKRPGFNLNQCLFGLHRINEDYYKSIAIVESEKTAIIMSIIIPDVIWLATGSKQNLKVKFIEPLIGRKIILYPDKGEFLDWQKKATVIKEFGYKIEVSNLLESTDFKPGFDLADYYLTQTNQPNEHEKNIQSTGIQF